MLTVALWFAVCEQNRFRLPLLLRWGVLAVALAALGTAALIRGPVAASSREAAEREATSLLSALTAQSLQRYAMTDDTLTQSLSLGLASMSGGRYRDSAVTVYMKDGDVWTVRSSNTGLPDGARAELSRSFDRTMAQQAGEHGAAGIHHQRPVQPFDASVRLHQSRLAGKTDDGSHGVEKIHHGHGEVALHNSLTNVQDIDVILRQGGAHPCDDADPVLTHNGNNCFHNFSPLQVIVCGHAAVQQVEKVRLCLQMEGMGCVVAEGLPALKLGVQGIVHAAEGPADFQVQQAGDFPHQRFQHRGNGFYGLVLVDTLFEGVEHNVFDHSLKISFLAKNRGSVACPGFQNGKNYSASSPSSSRARMDREMRLFSASTSVIFTFTSWPSDSTSSGLPMRRSAIWEM